MRGRTDRFFSSIGRRVPVTRAHGSRPIAGGAPASSVVTGGSDGADPVSDPDSDSDIEAFVDPDDADPGI